MDAGNYIIQENDWTSSAMIGNLTVGTGSAAASATIGYYQPYYPTGILPSSLYWVSTPPVRLTIGEFERLRKIARADPKLHDVLRKFTGHIELIVDLE